MHWKYSDTFSGDLGFRKNLTERYFWLNGAKLRINDISHYGVMKNNGLSITLMHERRSFSGLETDDEHECVNFSQMLRQWEENQRKLAALRIENCLQCTEHLWGKLRRSPCIVIWKFLLCWCKEHIWKIAGAFENKCICIWMPMMHITILCFHLGPSPNTEQWTINVDDVRRASKHELRIIEPQRWAVVELSYIFHSSSPLWGLFLTEFSMLSVFSSLFRAHRTCQITPSQFMAFFECIPTFSMSKKLPTNSYCRKTWHTDMYIWRDALLFRRRRCHGCRSRCAQHHRYNNKKSCFLSFHLVLFETLLRSIPGCSAHQQSYIQGIN